MGKPKVKSVKALDQKWVLAHAKYKKARASAIKAAHSALFPGRVVLWQNGDFRHSGTVLKVSPLKYGSAYATLETDTSVIRVYLGSIFEALR